MLEASGTQEHIHMADIGGAEQTWLSEVTSACHLALFYSICVLSLHVCPPLVITKSKTPL